MYRRHSSGFIYHVWWLKPNHLSTLKLVPGAPCLTEDERFTRVQNRPTTKTCSNLTSNYENFYFPEKHVIIDFHFLDTNVRQRRIDGLVLRRRLYNWNAQSRQPATFLPEIVFARCSNEPDEILFCSSVTWYAGDETRR